MVLRESDIQELKIVELEMLKCFISACKRLNLKYYVMYGTLLGAVRHQGFIPWDDDIDVGMFRQDYEVFIRNASRFLPNYYFVQCLDSDEECTMNFAKLRDSRTTFIESSLKNININHGVYIDIFPLDYYPEGKLKTYSFEFKKRLLSQAVRSEYSLQGSTEIWKKGLTKGAYFIFGSGKNAAHKLSILFKNQLKSEYIINNSGPWGNKKEIIPFEFYGDGIEVKFEGLNVTAPKEYDKWLRHMYGDYMQLPPVEKRVSHHYTEVIDLKHSYKEYYYDNEKRNYTRSGKIE